MNAARGRGGRPVDALLGSLPPICLVVGKGGVGKTTCSIGLTMRLGARGERTLLVSTDPAGSLGTALDVSLAPGERRQLPGWLGSCVMQLDVRSARTAFLARWRDTIATIMDRGTYLDREDIEGLVDAALPGADEIFAVLTLAELAESRETGGWQRLVVDTAPTGHTLRLLALPETFDAMIALLDAMQAKHRFMVSALTHRYRTDEADDFIKTMRHSIGAFRASLGDPATSGAVLVTRAEKVVVNETCRYAEALAKLHVATVAIVVDRLEKPISAEARAALQELDGIVPRSAMFALPRIEPPPLGAESIDALVGQLESLAPRRAETIAGEAKGLRSGVGGALRFFSGGAPRRASDVSPLSLLKTVTIVAGKGGVGKTTVSVALALDAALRKDRAGDVLLVSTDPAPSTGDALSVADPQWARRDPEPVQDVPRLSAWQMDASAAFMDLRDQYRDRIDELFDRFIRHGLDAAPDRAIMRDLLALAPPGIDELYALTSLGELLEEKRFETIIIDPAPTGHLLRLLEMPALAIEWSHRLMRLILKYREIASLGDAAQELVAFTRRTRFFDELLHDPTRAGVVLVSLDEPVVLAESVRLANALRNIGATLTGVVVNRRSKTRKATDASPEFRLSPQVGSEVPTFLAPVSDIPLVGVAAIRDWYQRWEERD